jgi:hypothetical protein
VRPNLGNADILREASIKHGNSRRIHPTCRCEMWWRRGKQSSGITKDEVCYFSGLGSSSTKTALAGLESYNACRQWVIRMHYTLTVA